MDKYKLVLEITEHPDNYTAEQLAEILSEPETREIFNILCKTDSAIEAEKGIDVETEWENLMEKHSNRLRRSFPWSGSRAASIAGITGISIVAVAAGIAVSLSIVDHKPGPIAEEAMSTPHVEAIVPETLTMNNDTAKATPEPMMFENESLEKIMQGIADAYGIDIEFNSREAASLHLYYRLDTSLPINEVVEQLNTFEQINIKQIGNLLIID